jgi:hypothetical protein
VRKSRYSDEQIAAANGLMFGNAVSQADLKLLVVALIRGGVAMKGVRPLSNGVGSRAKVVEIGDWDAYKNCPVLRSYQGPSPSGDHC